MKIKKIEVKNFKSFDPNGITYSVQSGLNVIVGENNVGKSNIFKILETLIELLPRSSNFDIINAFHGEVDNDVEIKLSAKLDDEDIEFLMPRFSVPARYKKDFLEIFGDDLIITFTFSRFRREQLLINFGQMKIEANRGSYVDPSPKSGHRPDGWTGLVNTVVEHNESLRQAVSILLSPAEEVPHVLQFDQDLRDVFADLLRKNIIIFPEFRDRSTTDAKMGIFSSPKGNEVSSVLFNLKNGIFSQRQRYKKIQEYFSQIFPNLTLDVRQGYEIVVVQKDNHEVSQESIGAGIVEIIIFITHLIETKNHIFAIDEPELHLHPHAKRSVSDLIKKSAQSNQILCITHSTNFIHTDTINNTTRVKDLHGHSELIHLPEKYFTTNEIKKLQRITESRQKEFFFARAVLLVEGDTEVGSIPILAKKRDQDLNLYNISVIGIDSHYFALFVKLLRGFKIPYMVMLDFDTLANIEVSIEIDSKKIKTSSLIKQLDELGELTQEDKMIIKNCEKGIIQIKKDNSKYNDGSINKLKPIIRRHKFIHLLDSTFEGLFDGIEENVIKNAKKNFKGSKVLQGKYLAENISKVPKDLIETIDKTVELTVN